MLLVPFKHFDLRQVIADLLTVEAFECTQLRYDLLSLVKDFVELFALCRHLEAFNLEVASDLGKLLCDQLDLLIDQLRLVQESQLLRVDLLDAVAVCLGDHCVVYFDKLICIDLLLAVRTLNVD